MSAVPSVKILIAATCAVALAACVGACGSSGGGGVAVPTFFSPAAHPSASLIDLPTDAQLRAYLKAHPAAALPGMTAGIRSFYASSPSRDIRCGDGRGSAVTVGNPGECLAWQVTLVTATGTLTVTCGNIAAAVPCESAVYSDRGPYPLPDTGDYLYAPSDGRVTASHDVRIIERDAIS